MKKLYEKSSGYFIFVYAILLISGLISPIFFDQDTVSLLAHISVFVVVVLLLISIIGDSLIMKDRRK